MTRAGLCLLKFQRAGEKRLGLDVLARGDKRVGLAAEPDGIVLGQDHEGRQRRQRQPSDKVHSPDCTAQPPGLCVVRGHVVVQNSDELGHDAVALERGHQAAIHVDRRLGSSNVPGSEMPMLECLDSPGPLTTQPITATFMVSTPGGSRFHLGICSRR